MIKVIPQYVPREPFTVLVSGGVDSIGAAHWLKHNYHKKFSILHFNHKVQPINDDMENSVKQFCIDFKIRYDSYFRTDGKFPDTSENGLREFRLSVMKLIGGKFVTAHHLDDAIENYLMNCFHGTPEHKPISEFTQFEGFSIYHPFLLTSKSNFWDYTYENNLRDYVVHDPTNADIKHKRNWVRNIIVPELNVRSLGIHSIVKKKFYTNLIKTEI
jgi:tRNA(Ile)-lysidine synthetase-like protein